MSAVSQDHRCGHNFSIADCPYPICDARNLLARLAEFEKRLNTPELHDFAEGVVLEAQHQRHRWGSDHDAGKQPEDWFWLLGYLSGKALAAHRSGDAQKALHHTISSAAALANWHSAILGLTDMRPGIDPAKRCVAPAGIDSKIAAFTEQAPPLPGGGE